MKLIEPQAVSRDAVERRSRNRPAECATGSKADIVELLLRNPNLDLSEVRDLCKRYRLQGLEELIREAQIQS